MNCTSETSLRPRGRAPSRQLRNATIGALGKRSNATEPARGALSTKLPSQEHSSKDDTGNVYYTAEAVVGVCVDTAGKITWRVKWSDGSESDAYNLHGLKREQRRLAAAAIASFVSFLE